MNKVNLEDDTVLVSKKRYQELIDAETKLMALEAAGVDNWSGYDEIFDIMEEWKKEGV